MFTRICHVRPFLIVRKGSGILTEIGQLGSQKNCRYVYSGFPGGVRGKNPPANAVDIRNWGSIHGSGQSPGRGHDNLLQYSCLENPMDRGAWWATVQRVTNSQSEHTEWY